MALEKNLLEYIKKLEERIQALERASQIKNVKIPAGGKIVVNSVASDPPVENGKIYYNTTTNKYKVCENGAWKTITTS